MGDLFSFKAFLSHKYKATRVNLYFFKLFSELAEVQFEVDEKKGQTNVTRLERMIRDADAFIGIYPFLQPAESGDIKSLMKAQSKYFRLELELAVRSHKPAVIFYDKRYENLLSPPESILSCRFDINEISGEGLSPSTNSHREIIKKFAEIVKRKKDFEDVGMHPEKTKVGLFVPSNDTAGYTDMLVEEIQTKLGKYTDYDLAVFDKIPVLNPPMNLKLLRLIDKLDFAIVDLGPEMMATGLPAYLHGRFMPSLRLKYKENGEAADGVPGAGDFLFAGTEAGYADDIIRWSNEETLLDDIDARLSRIYENVRRINRPEEAIEYFISADVRNEVVFLSYSGNDVEIATKISEKLKTKFKTVFNYKDGKSIATGEPWMEKIFDQLSKSRIAVFLLSQTYLNSGYCMHEAKDIFSYFDAGKIKVFPIKLEEPLEMPHFMDAIQYGKIKKYEHSDDIITEIIELLSDKK